MANYVKGVDDQLLIFMVEGEKHALYLSHVDKVEFAVEISPLPEAPLSILGTINWRGQVLPVMSMRKRLHRNDKKVHKNDRLLIVQYSRRRMALLVDEVVGIVQVKSLEITSADSVSEGLGCVMGLLPIDGGILSIHDTDLFLNEEEEKKLEAL